jgi:hypothetical protein
MKTVEVPRKWLKKKSGRKYVSALLAAGVSVRVQ